MSPLIAKRFTLDAAGKTERETRDHEHDQSVVATIKQKVSVVSESANIAHFKLPAIHSQQGI